MGNILQAPPRRRALTATQSAAAEAVRAHLALCRRQNGWGLTYDILAARFRGELTLGQIQRAVDYLVEIGDARTFGFRGRVTVVCTPEGGTRECQGVWP